MHPERERSIVLFSVGIYLRVSIWRGRLIERIRMSVFFGMGLSAGPENKPSLSLSLSLAASVVPSSAAGYA